MLSTVPSAHAQGRDTVRLTDGRELQGLVTSQRFDRVDLSMRSGMSTSLRWNDVESIDFFAPRAFAEGLTYESMGLHDKASASFLEARDLDGLRRPLKQEVLYHLARLRAALGDKHGSLANYRALVSEFPRGRYLGQATRGLVVGLLAEGKADDARAVLDEVEPAVTANGSAERLAAEITLLRGLVMQAQSPGEKARLLFERASASAALDSSDHARAALGIARALGVEGQNDAALMGYRNVVEMEGAPEYVLASAWNGLADAALEQGRSGRDAERITQALFGYLRGVVLYLPERAEPRDEYRRALAGAAQCFEYLSQLATNTDDKLLNRRRAEELRHRLDADDG
jgi:tetratricopeptide (TPR) repeat protein